MIKEVKIPKQKFKNNCQSIAVRRKTRNRKIFQKKCKLILKYKHEKYSHYATYLQSKIRQFKKVNIFRESWKEEEDWLLPDDRYLLVISYSLIFICSHVVWNTVSEINFVNKHF